MLRSHSGTVSTFELDAGIGTIADDDGRERVDREPRLLEMGRLLAEVERGKLEQAVAVVRDDIFDRCGEKLALGLSELGEHRRFLLARRVVFRATEICCIGCWWGI